MPQWTKTQEGRIVYDRKPHMFTVRDIERITEKVLENASAEPRATKIDVVDRLIRYMEVLGGSMINYMLGELGTTGIGDDIFVGFRNMLDRLVKKVDLSLGDVTPGGDPGPGQFKSPFGL